MKVPETIKDIREHPHYSITAWETGPCSACGVSTVKARYSHDSSSTNKYMCVRCYGDRAVRLREEQEEGEGS